MARMRSQENALGQLLMASPRPFYAIDEQRRIVFCNAACGDLLGIDSDQLIGQRCDYHATGEEATPADIAASLCPPPEVFAGRLLTAKVTVLHSTGELLDRHAEYLPLGTDALHSPGVLTILFEPSSDSAWPEGASTETAALHGQLFRLRRAVLAEWPIEELVGNSPSIERVRQQIALACRGRSRVLVLGPAGSGREHVARLVHRRATSEQFGPLIPLCCPLLDAELLQTTIARLVRDAATWNDRRTNDARTPATPPPTLLLLEVDQLADDAQSELAGFLTLPDFELYTVATAQNSLFALAEQGRFREELAHALSTLVIDMPPLAARCDDIPLLCQFFVEKFNRQGGRQLSGFAPEAIDELCGYGWPDNIDELSEVVETACQRAEGPFVEKGDLPEQIGWASIAEAHPRRRDEPIVLSEFLEQVEKELIERALKKAKGNKTKTAQLLGMTRARLHRRLEHFDLP